MLDPTRLTRPLPGLLHRGDTVEPCFFLVYEVKGWYVLSQNEALFFPPEAVGVPMPNRHGFWVEVHEPSPEHITLTATLTDKGLDPQLLINRRLGISD